MDVNKEIQTAEKGPFSNLEDGKRTTTCKCKKLARKKKTERERAKNLQQMDSFIICYEFNNPQSSHTSQDNSITGC
jgi:hypothetical protein